jgi:hypothetical protein
VVHYARERSFAVDTITVIGRTGLRKIKALGILFLCVSLSELGSQLCQLMEALKGGAEVLHHFFQFHRQRACQFPNFLLVRGDGLRRVINNGVGHAMEPQQILAKGIADPLGQTIHLIDSIQQAYPSFAHTRLCGKHARCPCHSRDATQ